MKKLLIIASIIMSGCTTIYFDNGEQDKTVPVQKKWHHNYLFSLIEGSKPVNLDNECGEKEWSSVKTELSFINGLAGGAVNTVGPIWYPKTVEISCK